jgi:hypothetical protein
MKLLDPISLLYQVLHSQQGVYAYFLEILFSFKQPSYTRVLCVIHIYSCLFNLIELFKSK